MNNVIRKINYFLLFIVSISMLYYTILLNIKMATSFVILVLIGLFNILDVKKNRNEKDTKYEYMLLLTNIVVVFILIRELFDMSIPMHSITYYGSWTQSGSGVGMYLDFNIPYIIIMYLGILIYLLINRQKI